MSETNGEKIRGAAESTAALIFARFAMPIMITLIGALGTYVLYNLDTTVREIRTANEGKINQIWQGLSTLKETTSATHDKVIELSSQANDVKAMLSDHEGRMRVLEHPRVLDNPH